jgi:hypothetical protein
MGVRKHAKNNGGKERKKKGVEVTQTGQINGKYQRKE